MPPRSPSRRARLLLAILSALALAAPARAAAGDDERLVLAASLDGGPVAAEPVLVRRQGAQLWMRAADLRALGIAVKGAADEVALAAIPGLTASIDERSQTIALARPLRARRTAQPAPSLADPAPPLTPNGWGAALNYDMAVTRAGRRTTLAGLVDGVMFLPGGYAYGGAVVTGAGGMGQRRVVRLDTGFTTADPGTARRWTLGDFIAGATERSRPVRMAGVQLATDFGLRPDLVTVPLPAFGAGAAVPSGVDVIAAGAHGRGRGRFAPAEAPVQSGVNGVTVAVRDALGRVTRQTITTYSSRALLRRGLSAYSLEAGLIRSGYGGPADRYGAAAASGSVRAGLSDTLTVEGHGELAGRVGNAGGGASLGLGRAGLVSAGLGVSIARQPGLQWGLGYERLARPVSVAVRYTHNSAGWRDLAADGGAATRAHQLIATLGFDLGRFGSAGVTAIDLGVGRPGRGVALAGSALAPSRLVTGSWSMRLAPRLNLVLHGGVDTRQRRTGFLSAGALWVLGSRTSAYGGALTRADGTSATAEWSRTALAPGDWGFRAAMAQGASDRLAGGVTYQGPVGRYGAEVERAGRGTAARLSARGALAIGGDGVLAADRLTGSYAVVDAGRPGVSVFRDGRLVGRTGARGKLVVPDLPAFGATRLAVDSLELPDEVAIDTVEQQVRPAARAGVSVRFGVRPARAATLRLLLADGRPVPAGARLSVNGGPAFPVGLDGEAWLPDVQPTNRLLVTRNGAPLCASTFRAPVAWRPGARVGPVVCATPSTPTSGLRPPPAPRP